MVQRKMSIRLISWLSLLGYVRISLYRFWWGDFNIIKRKEEKNNDNFNSRWPFIFNDIIESLDLRSLALSGRQFTWENRRDTPTYEKLDRILVSTEWE
jgi:hypothetical protein